MNNASPKLATFRLYRDHDVSGISGEGVVAEGVQFSDGWVVTHWLDQPPMHEPKTDVWHHKGTHPVTKIHGHGGATRIVWTDEEASRRREELADIVAMFDVPAAAMGTEAARAGLRRQLTDAIQSVQDGQAAPVEVGDERIVDAVMPVVDELLAARDRAQQVAGRAYLLADRWEAAHGSAMFLVRAAGAELREVLDNARDELDGAAGEGRTVAASGPLPPAAECSAQRRVAFEADPRECIRAAQHRGDHIDEQGFHWSDTVAVYPLADGTLREGPAAAVQRGQEHAAGRYGSEPEPQHDRPTSGTDEEVIASQQSRQATPGEDIRELYSRVAKLSDRVAALHSPKWGAETGILSKDHPLYPKPSGWAAAEATEPNSPASKTETAGTRVSSTLAEGLTAPASSPLHDLITNALGRIDFILPIEHRRKAADEVLAALLGPIPANTDTATWTAVRAIQIMNEAGRERDAARAALARWKRELQQALGMDATRDWDDIRNAAAGTRKAERAAQAALERVRALRDDLRGVTGARWIADALDKILDGTEQPTTEARQ